MVGDGVGDSALGGVGTGVEFGVFGCKAGRAVADPPPDDDEVDDERDRVADGADRISAAGLREHAGGRWAWGGPRGTSQEDLVQPRVV